MSEREQLHKAIMADFERSFVGDTVEAMIDMMYAREKALIEKTAQMAWDAETHHDARENILALLEGYLTAGAAK